MSELRQTMERILHLLTEIDEIKADVREVYAEAKSAGYDKTALGQAIREIRNRDKNATPEAEERQAIVSLYLAEFDAPHAGARAIASAVPAHEAA
jgi:uncharacterized protein (UPF0335 family)